MARRSRGANRGRTTRASAAPPRTPTPAEPSDEEMPDAPSEQDAQQEDAEEDGNEDREDDEVEDEGDDGVSTPVAEPEEPSRLRARASPIPPPRRRPGRPPKRPVDWDAADGDRTPSETPKRRGGFRGGSAWRGGRWKNRGQTHAVQIPLDKEGNTATVINDEVELPEDPEGETKVDKNGYLQEGREYRVRTFTVTEKGDRLYMLSTEPARCIGFRDSYLFFQKHRTLFKIILSDEAKRDLIERDLIPHSYKGRAIGVVTARSVFREFGAKIIIGGRKILDDYSVTEARMNGDVEGELAVPEDVIPPPGEEYDRNRYVAWHGASAVYHTVVPSVPMTQEKPGGLKKRRVPVTGSNWMLEHARAASRFNSLLAAAFCFNVKGVYEIYTNQMHYPAIMQHTHAKWEPIPPPDGTDSPTSTPNNSYTNLPNGNDPPPLTNGVSTTSSSSSPIIPTPPSTSGNNVSTSIPTTTTTTLPDGTLLHQPPALATPLPQIQYNRALTIDTHVRYPPSSTSTTGYPGPDGGTYDLAPKGLCDVNDDIIDLLPPECRISFEEARDKEREWKGFWGIEATDGRRVGPGSFRGGVAGEHDEEGQGVFKVGELKLMGGTARIGRGSYSTHGV